MWHRKSSSKALIVYPTKIDAETASIAVHSNISNKGALRVV